MDFCIKLFSRHSVPAVSLCRAAETIGGCGGRLGDGSFSNVPSRVGFGEGAWARDWELVVRGLGGRVKDQGALVVEAVFLWDPVGGDALFREDRLGIGVVSEDPPTDGGRWRVDGLESIEVEWGIGRRGGC